MLNQFVKKTLCSYMCVYHLQNIKADGFQYATGAAYCISHALMTEARKYFEYVTINLYTFNNMNLMD